MCNKMKFDYDAIVEKRVRDLIRYTDTAEYKSKVADYVIDNCLNTAQYCLELINENKNELIRILLSYICNMCIGYTNYGAHKS